jgi:translation initiation factor 1 (eIF-1/SUI1)
MYTIKETKVTKQIELLNEAGEVAHKACKTCNKLKLAEEFPVNSDGRLRASCQPCYKEYKRQYDKVNKDRRTVLRHKKRAEKLGLPDSFTEEELSELKAFAAGKCMISGEEVELQVDHVQAVSKGWLGNMKGNMILVSEKVNHTKGTMSIFEFVKSERSNGLIDREQLERTFQYLAQANEMSFTEYVDFLRLAEELANKNKEYWR